MTVKEEILFLYAFHRVRWFASLTKSACSLTLNMVGCSFLAGYYLSQHSVILCLVEVLLVVVLAFALVNILRDWRRGSQPPIEPWLMKAAYEKLMKEAQDESTPND